MTGNVREWTADYYDPAYYAGSPVDDPKGPAGGKFHVSRGASHYDAQNAHRLSRRVGEEYPGSTGFRCVRDTPPAEPNRLLP
jgi:formylglycine-generating enzyme required for sulfatase activity